jgi:hypothetical protein
MARTGVHWPVTRLTRDVQVFQLLLTRLSIYISNSLLILSLYTLMNCGYEWEFWVPVCVCVCVCIVYEFYGAVSISGHSLEWYDSWWIMNKKRFWWKQPWPHRCTAPEFSWKGWGKLQSYSDYPMSRQGFKSSTSRLQAYSCTATQTCADLGSWY